MRNIRRVCSTFVSFAVVLFLFSGCEQQPTPNTNIDTLQKVTIGYLPIASGLPLYVALENGYFEKNGFKPELHRFISSNEIGIAGTAGKIDAMMPFALNAGFDIGSVSGKKHTLFGVNIYSDQKPHIVDYLVARVGSDIHKVSDIRGKRIGAFPGSVTKIFVQYVLKKHGVQPSEYTYVELTPKDWEPALQSGSIDALSVMEPQFSQIMADGVGEIIVEGLFAKLMPDVPLSGHWLTNDFMQKNSQETVKRFISVFDKSVDFIRNNPDEAKKYYLKYTGIRASILPRIQLNSWRKSTEINAGTIQSYIDILAKNKALQAHVSAKDYVYSPTK